MASTCEGASAVSPCLSFPTENRVSRPPPQPPQPAKEERGRMRCVLIYGWRPQYPKKVNITPGRTLGKCHLATGTSQGKTPRARGALRGLQSSLACQGTHTYHNQAPYTTALAHAPSHLSERATHAHPLHPAALASVPYGVVLVRVRML